QNEPHEHRLATTPVLIPVSFPRDEGSMPVRSLGSATSDKLSTCENPGSDTGLIPGGPARPPDKACETPAGRLWGEWHPCDLRTAGVPSSSSAAAPTPV